MRGERRPDFYALLELPSTATEADIKKAWQEQMQVWHPDRFTHSPVLHRKAETRTQLINQAYQTLSDPIARTRYDAATQPSTAHSSTPSTRPTPPPRPQPAPRPRQDFRGPQSLITLSRPGRPKITVPAVELLVNVHEKHPYDFDGFVRIAGTTRQALAAGDYAIADAPDLWCLERRRMEEIYTIIANPAERLRFLRDLEGLIAVPHRYLLIEGAIQQGIAGGRLGQYHKNALMDFLDALTARHGIHIIQADTREEAQERAANVAALHYAYFYAEKQGLGRYLNENDL